uniref:Suppressor of tumorigenicity 7 protein n=1 Tax=Anguilla anguilla TaxID=7936 RepID=A0A0E9TK05_ANGAN
MNLSAQDHQTFFTCDSDHLRPADAIMQKSLEREEPSGQNIRCTRSPGA